jgi:AraC-like DNA-binding protein
MQYREFAPAADLRHCVDRYWSMQSGAGDELHPVFPDGHCELVAHLGDAMRRVHGGPEDVQPGCIFVGQMRTAVFVRATGLVDVFGIRFRPEGAWALLGSPQSELGGRIVSADDLLGRDACRWREGLSEVSDRLAWTNTFLRARIRKHSAPPVVRHAVVLAGRSMAVDQIAREANCSRRHLERLFAEYVGLTPKVFGRISRFQRALRARDSRPWIDVAHECGYADQAHLIADFREFAGGSPGQSEASRTTMGSVMSHLLNTTAGEAF